MKYSKAKRERKRKNDERNGICKALATFHFFFFLFDSVFFMCFLFRLRWENSFGICVRVWVCLYVNILNKEALAFGGLLMQTCFTFFSLVSTKCAENEQLSSEISIWCVKQVWDERAIQQQQQPRNKRVQHIKCHFDQTLKFSCWTLCCM